MKKLLAVVLCLALALSLAACGGAPSAPASTPASAADPASQPASEPASASSATGDLVEAIKAKGKLVVGTEATYAPFEFLDEKAEFAGCDIWLAQQIADALGVKLEVMDMAFDGIIPAVKAGQVDIGIAGFTVTEERAKEIDFSEIYQRDQQMLVVKKGNEDVYTTKESMAGQKIGAQRGTVQSILIQNALPDSELFELDKYPALALEVTNGNIAGLVVDGAVGEGLIANNKDLVKANFEFDPAEANFGKAAVLAKGSDSLMEIVNQVVTKAADDGSFQAAYDAAVEKAKSLGI